MSNLLKCPITKRKLYLVDVLPGVNETKVYRSTDRYNENIIYQSFIYNGEEYYKTEYRSNLRYFKIKNNNMVEFLMTPTDYFERKTIYEDTENSLYVLNLKKKLLCKKINNFITKEINIIKKLFYFFRVA